MSITREQIESVEESVDIGKAKLRELKKEFAEQQCPLEVGQIVECCGYSHKGKKMKISNIFPPKFWFEGDWRVVGIVIKKDGTEGAQTADFSQKQWESAQ